MSSAPKKKFGQNFLTNPEIPKRIVASSGADSETEVLEIGPGKGIMTRELCRVCKKVVCVEIDTDLESVLTENLKDFDNVRVIYGDIMKFDIDALINENFSARRVKVIANLPYYITTPIIMKLLASYDRIESVTVMVQKEVAARMCAKPGSADYGAFTVAVTYYSDIIKCFNVSRGSFFPVPNVDSAVVRMDVRKNKKYVPVDEDVYFATVAASFGQRRKTLLNALSALCSGKENAASILSNVGIDSSVRGETLSPEQFCIIADEISKHNK